VLEGGRTGVSKISRIRLTVFVDGARHQVDVRCIKLTLALDSCEISIFYNAISPSVSSPAIVASIPPSICGMDSMVSADLYHAAPIPRYQSLDPASGSDNSFSGSFVLISSILGVYISRVFLRIVVIPKMFLYGIGLFGRLFSYFHSSSSIVCERISSFIGRRSDSSVFLSWWKPYMDLQVAPRHAELTGPKESEILKLV